MDRQLSDFEQAARITRKGLRLMVADAALSDLRGEIVAGLARISWDFEALLFKPAGGDDDSAE